MINGQTRAVSFEVPCSFVCLNIRSLTRIDGRCKGSHPYPRPLHLLYASQRQVLFYVKIISSVKSIDECTN